MERQATDNICQSYSWIKGLYPESIVTKEMQMKTTMRYHYPPIRMAEVKTPGLTQCWCGFGRGLSYSAGGNVRCYSPFGKHLAR